MKETRRGQKFGRWTVIHKVRRKDRSTGYLCECSCGTRKIVASNNLITGRSTQCKECFNYRFGRAASKMTKEAWKSLKRFGKKTASEIFIEEFVKS